MNLDEFQSVGSNASASNSDASKQFHSYTNGVFNGKMLANSTATNFAFPYEKHQQPQQHHMNGLLKPCYDFSTAAPTKSEPLDEANFNSGFATKKPSQAPLFGTASGGFINQFSHHHDYGNVNSHHQAFASKLNEINNNISGGGGIVVKLENGGSEFNAMRATAAVGGATSTMVVNKTEPNEFRNSNCKDNHVDNEDEERKTSLHHDNDSNDGFTQL